MATKQIVGADNSGRRQNGEYMNLSKSKTEANLLAAFSGESQARNKYTFYAGKARKDGYEQIAQIFEETAKNEQAHAKIWFTLLAGGNLEETAANLRDAATGENFEWSSMYADFEKTAREEGFSEIATLFHLVGEIEKSHEQRFNALLENLQQKTVFDRPDKVIWICKNCGHIYVGTQAPTICPVCKHPQAYFEIKAENY